MKKSITIAAALLAFAVMGATAQDTTSAGKQAGGKNKSSTAAQISNSTNSGTGGQQAQKTSLDDASNRPGGAEHKNANDVGRYSESSSDEKSMLNSKDALKKRRKNLTEADTTMKKGSGSAARNTKNNTGKTGNYRNRDAKQSLPKE